MPVQQHVAVCTYSTFESVCACVCPRCPLHLCASSFFIINVLCSALRQNQWSSAELAESKSPGCFIIFLSVCIPSPLCCRYIKADFTEGAALQFCLYDTHFRVFMTNKTYWSKRWQVVEEIVNFCSPV